MSAVVKTPTLTVVTPEVVPMRPEQPVGMFNIPGCTITPVGMIIEPGLDIKYWVAAGLALRRAGDAFQLCVGDWIRYGKSNYKRGEMYEEALALTGYQERTLQNNVWVANKVPLPLRLESSPRGEQLKFKHYKTLASLPSQKAIKKWLTRALKGDGTKIWSAARLGREINKAIRPSESETKVKSEIRKLHDKIVQEELDEKILAVDKWLETPADPLLSKVYRRLREILRWQRDRTIEGDCAAIMKIFTGDAGTEAPERVTDDDLAAWLRGRGFIMSKEEIGQAGYVNWGIEPSGRIGLMLRLRMLTVESREESRGDGQKGRITHVYAAQREYLGKLEDISDLEPPARSAALRKDWSARLERYAPELVEKKDEAQPCTP